jgi:hypothetical protein
MLSVADVEFIFTWVPSMYTATAAKRDKRKYFKINTTYTSGL